MGNVPGEPLAAMIQQINNRTRQIVYFVVGRSTEESCEVKDTNKKNLRHVVEIGGRGCNSLEWQHNGKLCEYALTILKSYRDCRCKFLAICA